MNPGIYEQIMSLLGLIALWAFWYYLWKPQRIDFFRQRLFALRSDLFDLAANGVVPFDHPAYTQLRLLINGMIRFGHRVTFPTLMVAAAQSKDVTSDPLAEWKKNVQELPEGARDQLLVIHSGVSKSVIQHLIGGSVVLSTYVLARVLLAVTRAFPLLLIGKRRLSNFTVSHARSKMDRETNQVARAGADVIEANVLQEEQRRTSMKSRHVYAH
ncbi:MAG: hypothetical protein ABSG62_02340 [Terracidiphilus sp.]|jgi:hypothetical protein